MLLIPCPHCGPRDESEFDYGGRALVFPDLDAGPGEWHAALHLPDPCADRVSEYWYHAGGCECWIRLTRDLHSHEFLDEAQS